MPRGWQRSVLFDWCKRELTPLSTDYRDFILDQFSQVEGVMPRRMFGGLGLFKDSVMFGILNRMDGFHLKVDDPERLAIRAVKAYNVARRNAAKKAIRSGTSRGRS